MTTITKREIAERVAKKTDHPQLAVKQIIQCFFDEVINEVVNGNRLEFRDFGVFEVITRKSRTGRNPRTGDKVPVPAKRVVSFKMGKLMKERVAAIPPEEEPDASSAPPAPSGPPPSPPPTPPPSSPPY